MHSLIEQLLGQGPIVTDGAWGTQLQARGLEVGECPDVWNLSHPKLVAEVARAYVEAGSQIILTNTFGANRARASEQGIAPKTEAIKPCGVEISFEARGRTAKGFCFI